MKSQTRTPKPVVALVRFQLDMPGQDYIANCDLVADTIAEQPGVLLKLWGLDQARASAASAYLFRDRESAVAYFDGPVIAKLRAAPIRNLEVQIVDLMQGPSSRTGAAPLLSGRATGQQP